MLLCISTHVTYDFSFLDSNSEHCDSMFNYGCITSLLYPIHIFNINFHHVAYHPDFKGSVLSTSRMNFRCLFVCLFVCKYKLPPIGYPKVSYFDIDLCTTIRTIKTLFLTLHTWNIFIRIYKWCFNVPERFLHWNSFSNHRSLLSRPIWRSSDVPLT